MVLSHAALRVGREDFSVQGPDTEQDQLGSLIGHDDMSVVDGQLKVYGVEGLRIADASILPHLSTGNTMAPCVVIGGRVGEILRVTYKV